MKLIHILQYFRLSVIFFLLHSCGTPYEKAMKCYDRQDYVKAVYYFQKVADQGDAEAMAYLGQCYFQGLGVEKNEKQAFNWNLKGAEKNNKRAQQNLKFMADHGSKLAKEYNTFTERMNARIYQVHSVNYNPDNIQTYTLPNHRYLASMEEYLTFLRTVIKINTDFPYKTDYKYCWITSYERNKYWNIFKLANPYSPELAVDLGLSVKWASKNVGAKRMTDLGGKFAWGEVHIKNRYTWLSYEYARGSAESIMYIGENISYTKYDAASVNWGPRWRMPTRDDYKELVSRCNLKWTKIEDKEGMIVIGPNGNHIFFPVEEISSDLGFLFNTHYYTGNLRTYGGLWSNANEEAHTFKLSSDGFDFGSQPRYEGCYIRPILVE